MLFYTLIPGSKPWTWTILILITLFFITGNEFIAYMLIADGLIARILLYTLPNTYAKVTEYMDKPLIHILTGLMFALLLFWLILEMFNMLNFNLYI